MLISSLFIKALTWFSEPRFKRCQQIPLTIVFTKCDKTKKKVDGRKLEDNLKDFLRLLKKSYDQMPPWIMTSCVTNNGRDQLLQHLVTLRNYWSE